MYIEKEKTVIQRTNFPITKERLKEDFTKLGIKKGDILFAHISMSKIGWIVGGAITVIEAFQEVLTEDGSLVLPTFTTGNTNPANWQNPPVPKEWIPVIKANMPPFKKEISPTRGLGRIPDIFRIYPDTCRSDHPQCSFTSWGKFGKQICSRHPLYPVFGDESPLGKMYLLGAKILLLGVNHDCNTSFHYSEYKAGLTNHPKEKQGAAILVDGRREWVEWEDLVYDSEDFINIGRVYNKSLHFRKGLIGQAESFLYDMKDVVDFGVEWLKKHRKY